MGNALVSLGFFYPLVLPFSPSSSRFAYDQSAPGIFIKPEPEELHTVPSSESTRYNVKNITPTPTIKAELSDSKPIVSGI